MAAAGFEHPRLTAIYDALDADRSDTSRGVQVTGVDPASAMLDIACAKPGAGSVTWVHGTAAEVPALQANLVTMTGNVAQAIADPADWEQTLRRVHAALRPGGHLVFDTRDPSRRQWEEWNRAASLRTTDVPGVGAVQSWHDVSASRGPLVAFRTTYVFTSDGAVLTSASTLRFREREVVEAQLHACGYVVDDVRDAPDRPGRELVFAARRQQ